MAEPTQQPTPVPVPQSEDNSGDLTPPSGLIAEGSRYIENNPEAGPPPDTVVENSPISQTLVNPGMGAEIGAATGVVSKAVNPVLRSVIGTGTPNAAGEFSIFRADPRFSAVENYGRQMHAGKFYGGEDYADAYRRGMEAKKAAAHEEAMRQARAMFGEVPKGPTAGEKATEAVRGLGKVLSPEAEGILGKIATGTAHIAGRALAGGMAGQQAYDAYNRFQEGDIPGAVIGGIGALGSAASMIPTPITRVVGTGVGMTAEGINYLRDHPELLQHLIPEGHAVGGLVALK